MRLLLGPALACLALACSPSDGDAPKSDASADACAVFDVGPAYEAPPRADVDPLDEDAAVDSAPPDVGPVVTRAEIDDIIKNSCAFNTCHGKKPGAGGLYLPAPPANWVVELVNQPSVAHKTMKRIVPGDPSQSFFVQKLGPGLCALAKDCVDGNCGDRMPQTSTPLPAFEVTKIVEWIRQGASDK